MPATPAIFGRERELAELTALAAAGADLVTISGPGGIGKSHLARVVAPSMASAAGLDAAVSIDLHEASDRTEVVAAFLAALGAQAGGETSAELSAARALETAGPVLVVVDGCERCVDVVREIVAGRRPGGARLLVTSQIELGLSTERLVRLGVLPVPARGASREELSANPAAQLYADRRRRRVTGYRLEDEQEDALLHLLERLDGVPLAIELAAARARSLSTAELVARLDSTVALLSSEAPDLPPRQRSMTAAVAWSWSLLGDHARDLLGAVSMFRAPFTLPALEAIAGAFPLEAVDELVSHSLLELVDPGGGRYRSLDSIRSYARAQLTPARRAELQLRHATFVVSERERYFLEFLTHGRSGAAPEHVRSADDLRAAYDAALDAGDHALAARAGAALASSRAWLGLVGAARTAILDAYERTAAHVDEELWSMLALHFMSLLDDQPPLGAAGVARLTEAARTSSSAVTRTRALRILAAFHFKRDDLSRALTLGATAIETARAAGVRLELAFNLGNQAKYLNVAGRAHEAYPLAEEAVRITRAVDVPFATGTSLSILAACQIETGDLDGAAATLRAAVAWTRDARWSSASFANSMSLLAESMLVLGKLGEAEALLDEADTLVGGEGGVLDAHRGILGTLLLARGFLAELRGQPRAALASLEGAQLAFESVGSDLSEAVAWTRIAWASAELGRALPAAAALERARARAGAGAPPWFGDLLTLVAEHGASPPPVRDVEPLTMRLARAVAAARGEARPARYVLADDGRQLIDPSGRRIELGRRRAVARILQALAAAAPAAMSVHDLFTAAWPDQQASHESARNRVYVSLSTLRKLGAGGVVRSIDGGYQLAPGIEIVTEEA